MTFSDFCHSQIRSDTEEQGQELTKFYSLLGPGASQVPVNVFYVGEKSGKVFIRGKLDREKIEFYNVSTLLVTFLLI